MAETRLEQVLRAGLAWLYDVEQPDGAMPSHLGDGALVANRRIGFIPRTSRSSPAVVFEVARPCYDDARAMNRQLLNPIYAGEMAGWDLVLRSVDAHPVESWNGDGFLSGSVGLAGFAHKSMLAGLRRYHDGCPEHGSVFCGHHSCDWLKTGRDLVVAPAFPRSRVSADA